MIPNFRDSIVITSKKMNNTDSKIRPSRHLRNRNVCRQQNYTENVDKNFDGGSKMSEKTDHCSKSVYGQVEDNNAYQELGEITRETQYDKLY